MTSTLIDNLIAFNLTRQEATIYVEFLNHGEMSGYEVAKETGISRSNVYSALQSLAEKGALYLIEGETTKYTPVPINIFLKNTLTELQKKAQSIEETAPKMRENSEGYITILGSKNIKNKICQMLKEAKERIYMMVDKEILLCFINEITALLNMGKKVVILSNIDNTDFLSASLTDKSLLSKTILHKTQTEKYQIRLIVDSSFVLTGELSDNVHDTCLYSGQKNLVTLMKEALKNKIELLEQ